MIGLGLFLTACGVADFVSGGLAGDPVNGRAVLRATVVAAVLTAVCSYGLGLSLDGSLLLLALVVATVLIWLYLRCPDRSEANRCWALASLAAGTITAMALGPVWEPADEVVSPWLDTLPYGFLGVLGAPGLILMVGVLAFLAATSNGIVRTVLALVGTEFRNSEQRLRGGRLIGVLERGLIFSLAVAGEPTAAALIVSAKSLLRFPELTRVAQEAVDEQDRGASPEVDYVTEYFLLGSLLSWSLALAPTVLFR